MPRASFLFATLATLALMAAVAAGPASAAPAYVPGELIVKREGASSSTTVSVAPGESVKRAAAELDDRRGVAYARPNYIARASAYTPNDPGFPLQWNLATSAAGINMPDAWATARSLRRPGGRNVVIAVLDTGVAYQRFRRFRRAPDLNRFVRGYDFVAGDRHPNDQNGHGTHVAGTIAQSTGNGVGTAGIAYRARIMPVRVLDASGAGDTLAISRGIRFAARRGADVINLSLEFDAGVRAAQIPDIVSALTYARRRGAIVIAAAGNQGSPQVAYPARARRVMAVAATTARGCQAEYSNSGVHVDIAAPGGGADAANTDTPYDVAICRPGVGGGEFIYQQTFTGSVARFGLPPGYEGTSMAAPHVSGVAALLIGSGQLGPDPGPVAVERRLKSSARDIGSTGWDPRYGWGLLDAAAALREPAG
ncbi:MAG TPA: S8 family serine peptidase [Thermoleophilaceae bacterium]|nr:S8 family serine peptidase [Thermoleophilaceae bacterium]